MVGGPAPRHQSRGLHGGGVLHLFLQPDHGRAPPGRRRLLRGARDDRARSLRAATRHSAGAGGAGRRGENAQRSLRGLRRNARHGSERHPVRGALLARGDGVPAGRRLRCRQNGGATVGGERGWLGNRRGGDAAGVARAASSARTSSCPVDHGPSPRRAPSWYPSPSWAKTFPMGRSSPESARV